MPRYIAKGLTKRKTKNTTIGIAETGRPETCKRLIVSFGSMRIVMSYMTRIEQSQLQVLNQFMYQIGVSRCQSRIERAVWKTKPFSMTTIC